METADGVKSKLQSLIAQSNAATGNADADITAAITALISGFGKGGGNAIQIGQETPSPNWSNLFWALEQGTAATGTFTLASPLSGETLIFSSELPGLNGILLVNTDRTKYSDDLEGVWFGLGLLSGGELMASFALNTAANGSVAKTSFIIRGERRIDGGDLYVTPYFPGNSQYTPFRPGETYRWVAW